MSQPTTTDFLAPFDPTGYTSITGAMLLQILEGLYPNVNQGLMLITTDVAGNPTVPNAVTNTKWQHYLWLRVSATSIGVYAWNPNGASDATYLQWISINIAGIGAGSIVNNMLADNTIQSVKIVSLDYSKLSGAPTGLPPSGSAGGSLTGTYPNPLIGNGAVTSAMFAAGSILTVAVADLNITIGKLGPASGSAKDMIRVNAGATGMEAFTPPVVFTSGVVVPTANALKIPQVNAGATDFQMVATTTLGRILQIVEILDITVDTTNITTSDAVTLPTTSTTKHITGLDTAFTPISAASTLLVDVGVWLDSSVANRMVTAGLFQDAGANAIAAGCNDCQNAGLRPILVNFKYKVASGSLTARTFKVGFGGTATNTRYNSTDGTTTMFGGALGISSWVKVTEYI